MMDNPIDGIKKRQEALKRDRLAGVGEVGIFWLYDNSVLQQSVPFTQGDDYGDYVNGKEDHYTFWRSFQRIYPSLQSMEYDEIPRGRVVYSKKDKTFYVYGSKKFMKDTKNKNRVMRDFGLSKKNTIFKSDLHYEMDSYTDLSSIVKRGMFDN